jgi:hypothetical protein
VADAGDYQRQRYGEGVQAVPAAGYQVRHGTASKQVHGPIALVDGLDEAQNFDAGNIPRSRRPL